MPRTPLFLACLSLITLAHAQEATPAATPTTLTAARKPPLPVKQLSAVHVQATSKPGYSADSAQVGSFGGAPLRDTPAAIT